MYGVDSNCSHCQLLKLPRRPHEDKCIRDEFREQHLAAGDWHDCPLYRGPGFAVVAKRSGKVEARSNLMQQEVLW